MKNQEFKGVEQLFETLFGFGNDKKSTGDLIEIATTIAMKKILDGDSAATKETVNDVLVTIQHEDTNQPVNGAGTVTMITKEEGIAMAMVGSFSLSDLMKMYLTFVQEIRSRLHDRVPEPVADNMLLELYGLILEKGSELADRKEMKI